MIQFNAPAKYRRFLEATMALALAEIGRDADRRADDDPRVQRLATVPDHLIAPEKTGRLLIAIAEDTPQGIDDLSDHLHAFLTASR